MKIKSLYHKLYVISISVHNNIYIANMSTSSYRYIVALNGCFDPDNDSCFDDVKMVTSDIEKAMSKAMVYSCRVWPENWKVSEVYVAIMKDGSDIKESLVKGERIFEHSYV